MWKDLDEYNHRTIIDEALKRCACLESKVCSYCGKKIWMLPCKMEQWHRPKIITLCGSTRFKDQYIEVQRKLTLEGMIVISVGLFGHQEEAMDMQGDIKKILDRLHLHKIDLSDAIYVINVGGYIGESTKREIEYAVRKGKETIYLEW